MHGGGASSSRRRLKRAAESAETEWIVLLEDDVRVERGVTRWPKEGIDGGESGLEVDSAPVEGATASCAAQRGKGAEL